MSPGGSPASLLGLLRAFAWMRWRTGVNALRKSGGRDTLERISRAASIVLPAVLVVVFVPALVLSAVAGVAAGYALGSGGNPARIAGALVRLGLLGLTVAVVIAPIVGSLKGGGANLTRLLLLPVPRRLLHAMEMASALMDPWILIALPFALTVPVGLLAAGAPVTALIALPAGLAFVLTLAGLETALMHGLALLYRNRRRGELVSLLVVVLLSMSGFIPALLSSEWENRERESRGRPGASGGPSSAGQNGTAADAIPGDGSGRATGQKSGPATERTAGRDPVDEDSAGSAAEASAGDGSGSAEGPQAGTTAADERAAGSAAGRTHDAGPGPAPGQTAAGDLVDEGAAGSAASASQPAGTAAATVPTGSEASRTAPPSKSRRGRRSGRSVRVPAWMGPAPSELYAQAVRGPVAPLSASLSLAGLAGMAGLFYGLSWAAYRRLLDSPETGSGARAAKIVHASVTRIPVLGPSAAAVTWGSVRLVLRTVQGKMAFWFSPLALLLTVLVLSRVGDRAVPTALGPARGPAFCAMGVMMLMLGFQKIAFNLFGTDRAGLTLQFLSPISERDIVVGKAAALGFLFGAPSLFIFAVAVVLSRDAPLLLWPALLLGAAGAFALYAPLACLISALFPRHADLGRAGSGGGPSPAAAWLGFVVVLVACVPPAGLGLIGAGAIGSPALALGLEALWAAAAIALAWPLLGLAARTVAARRENLALVAQKR